VRKVTILFALLLVAVSQGAFAQRTIRGQAINGEDRLPMPGVSVVIKGTTTGTATNRNGNFTLRVPNNLDTIVVSFVGFKTVEILVGSNTQFDIMLYPDAQVLGEVVVTARRNRNERVVTAMGIERDIKTLPYVVYHMSGDEIRRTGQSNVLYALDSKVPIQIRQWGQGPGAPVVAYGRLGMITLYIIDGFLVKIGVEKDRYGRIIDVYDDVVSSINILDIESITILPSANAAMLYGSDGRGGAIVITLKK